MKISSLDKCKITFKNINLWYLLLSTLFYYSVVFKDLEIACYLLYYIVPLIYIIINYKMVIRLLNMCFHNKLKYYILVLAVLFLVSLILPFVYGTHDFTYFSVRLIQVSKESLKILFLFLIFIKYISPKGDFVLFIKYFVLSTCMYILGSCVIMMLPSFRDTILALNKADANTMRIAHLPSYVTRIGWCGFSGFTYTLRCSLAGAFMSYIIYLEKKKNFYTNSLLLLIMALGNFFYGRVGVVVTGIFFMILLIMLFLNERTLFMRFSIMLGIACLVLAVLTLFSPKIRVWIAWVFQAIINFIQTGSFETSSMDSLKNMYFLPEIKTLLIGVGKYTNSNGTYYAGTDVGLLRPILFGGIFFQMLRYSTVLILIAHIKEYLNNTLGKACFLLIILFVIFEFKGEAVFPIVSILFGVSLVISYHKDMYSEKQGD